MKIAQVLIYCNCPHRLSLQYLSPPYPPPTASAHIIYKTIAILLGGTTQLRVLVG